VFLELRQITGLINQQKLEKLKVIDDYISEKITQAIIEHQSYFSSRLLIIASLALLALFLVLLSSKLISGNILKALLYSKVGLSHFFEYAIREKNKLEPMKVKGHDEFSQMIKEMNEQIIKTESLINKTKK